MNLVPFGDYTEEQLQGAILLEAKRARETGNETLAQLLSEVSNRLRAHSARSMLGEGVSLEDAPYVEIMKSRNKIHAIKKYREDKGVGLKDAKDAVDTIELRYGLRGR